MLHYEITNSSDSDLAIKPNAILVRADGRSAAFGMLRDSVDRSRPEVIPRGATETGVIDVAISAARKLEVTLSLVPVSAGAPLGDRSTTPEAHAGTIPSVRLPFILQGTFTGLDQLPVVLQF